MSGESLGPWKLPLPSELVDSKSGIKRSHEQAFDSASNLCSHLNNMAFPQGAAAEASSATGMQAARMPTFEMPANAPMVVESANDMSISEMPTTTPTAAEAAAAKSMVQSGVSPAALASQEVRPGQVIGQKSPKKARKDRKVSGAGEVEPILAAPAAPSDLNANNEEWERRLQKRVQALDTIRASELYREAQGDLDGAPMPCEPNAYDRECPKRLWEDRVSAWRADLRMRTIALVKATDLYKSARQVTSPFDETEAPAPCTPTPKDKSDDKQKWEEKMQAWKDGLKRRAAASS